ncbi:MAG: hypothetical protein ACR2MT_00555 [Aurantibacter sp.]
MMNEFDDGKKKARRRILIDSFGIFFIIVSPFIFKLHQYLPGNPEATIEFLGFIFDSNGFVDLNTYGWFLLSKLVPFYLLVIWFFTCKHWWYHIILIPATMYAFQIFEVVYSDDNIVDTKNIIWLLPVCMVVIPVVYLIRIKLYDKHVHGIDLEAMETELKTLKEKANYKPTTDEELERLKSKTLSEYINRKLSTRRLEARFQQFQHNIKNWLHLKF